MGENYLAKWLNNELDGEALEEFKKSTEYASYLKIIAATDQLEAPHFNQDAAWQAIKDRTQSKGAKVIPLNPYKRLMRIAAAVVLLVTGSYFYFNSLDDTAEAQLAEHTQLALPDKSSVFLNADSKVTYNGKRWDDERKLTLKGEAFFKVAKGKKFTVNTALGSVSVLGTQFNVVQRGDFFAVSCYEGLVSVSYNGNKRKLPAGSSFSVYNGSTRLAEVPKDAQPSWMDNESSFKSMPLHYVLDELQRQYDITVEANDIDMNKIFTGTFSNTNLNLALKSISTPTQISFTLDGDKVLFYAENTP